jgi:hypothetical protein
MRIFPSGFITCRWANKFRAVTSMDVCACFILLSGPEVLIASSSMPMRQRPPCQMHAAIAMPMPCEAGFAVHRATTRQLRNDGCGQIVSSCNHMLAFFCHVWHVGCVEVCVRLACCGVLLAHRLRLRYEATRYSSSTFLPAPNMESYYLPWYCSGLHADPRTHALLLTPSALHTKGRARQAFSLGHIVMRGARFAAFAGACVRVELVTLCRPAWKNRIDA